MDDADLLDLLRREFGSEVSFLDPPVLLGGGYYTANYAFRIANGPPGWQRPLVLRLFPQHAPAGLAEREASVQAIVSTQGIPAPPVLLYRNGNLFEGREWFIMAKLPGYPLMGALGLREALVRGPELVRRLPGLTARTQLELHRVDASPLIDRLSAQDAGVGRWLTELEHQVAAGASGLAAGLEWLLMHQPSPERLVICHGDLWGGNLLVENSQISGIIDWTLATVAEPAFDVGFTTMSLDLAPIPVSPAVRQGLLALTRWLKRRYVRLYRKGTDSDLSNLSYYEALRCVVELSGVVAYRTAQLTGATYDGPRPAWDGVADEVIKYFRDRTSIALEIPAPT